MNAPAFARVPPGLCWMECGADGPARYPYSRAPTTPIFLSLPHTQNVSLALDTSGYASPPNISCEYFRQSQPWLCRLHGDFELVKYSCQDLLLQPTSLPRSCPLPAPFLPPAPANPPRPPNTGAVTCPPGSFPPVANQSGTSFNFGVGSGLRKQSCWEIWTVAMQLAKGLSPSPLKMHL
jgi:hypothetical protein